MAIQVPNVIELENKGVIRLATAQRFGLGDSLSVVSDDLGPSLNPFRRESS
jgi:hypothetical protein